MNRLLSLNRQQLAFFTCCGMTIALVCSKFALTMGMIFLVLIGLVDLRVDGKFKFQFNPLIKINLKKLWQRKDFLVVMFFFVMILLSGVYSSDINYLSERLRIKLPFLLLPFAFVSIPSFTEKQYLSIFYLFNIVMTVSALLVGVNYLLDFEAITKSIGRGQAMPTPINHIRFSLLIAFSILSGAALWWKGFVLKRNWERQLILLNTTFLFFFIHVLSVRSGMLVLYASILFLSLRFMYLSKRYWLGLLMIAGVFLAPFIAYKTIPSIHEKIWYMRYDFSQLQQGNIENLSDAERFTSILVGVRIGNANPVLGVGAGDLKQEVKTIYENEISNASKPKMPHNQLVSVYAGMGFLGLFTFLFAFFYPLYYRQNYKDVLLTILHLIIFLSFFIENTIETAVGVAFYSLFLLIGLNKRNT